MTCVQPCAHRNLEKFPTPIIPCSFFAYLVINQQPVQMPKLRSPKYAFRPTDNTLVNFLFSFRPSIPEVILNNSASLYMRSNLYMRSACLQPTYGSNFFQNSGDAIFRRVLTVQFFFGLCGSDGHDGTFTQVSMQFLALRIVRNAASSDGNQNALTKATILL